ncbi:MAG: hypothetical protein FWE88_02720 [Phycisphaerae bacterium]|nr:hypothetical protein [Phycisphaerae bacterium]
MSALYRIGAMGTLSLFAWAILMAAPATGDDVPTSVPAIAPMELAEFATTLPAEAADVDTFDPDDPDNDYGGAGGPVFWLIVLFFCVVFVLILVMIGSFLALIAAGLLAALMMAGVLSSSAMAGIATRKKSTFFLWLSVQLGAILGALVVAAAMVAMTHAFDWPLRLRHAAILGGIAGLIGGAGTGFLCHRLGTRVLAWLEKRFARQKS